MSPAQRADTLAAAILALDGNVTREGLAWMIERTIDAALADRGGWAMLKIGTGTPRMCPRSQRPCGFQTACDAVAGCMMDRCHHLRTAQAVVGDSSALMRVQTTCLDCGAVLP